ncbi:MAG: glycosyltransferase family 2 protein [Candidatus Neomarinimicrobiota bacterium]
MGTDTAVQPKVSIIIPHWNGIAVLEECLQSLEQATYPDREIIVVDNASGDGSARWIAEHYPQVILIANDRNHGYAGGCNIGASRAAGELLVFLNNDTVQQADWLERLVEALQADSELAAVQPKILNYYRRDVFDYAGGSGGQMDILCYPFARGRLFLEQEVDCGQYDDAATIFWASGTAFMVRRTAFEAAGGFDETFFAHMEEIDLCWRLQLLGMRVGVAPAAVVYHKNAVSLPMQSLRKFYLNHRNSLYMLLTNYSAPLALYLFLLRYLLEWVAFGYALTKGDWRHMAAILQAQGWLLTRLPQVCRKRKLVKNLRRVPDRRIMERLYRGSVVLAYYLGGKKTYSAVIGGEA